MRPLQLIYSSRPFGFDDQSLNSILFKARQNNRRDGITGALVCRHDLYLQMLEGPSDLVTATYNRILSDDRHVEVEKLWSGDIEERMFPNWEMRHDPARSWMWTPDEVRSGAVLNASQDQLRAVFTRIAAEPYTEDSAIL